MTGRWPAERLGCAASPGNQATTTGRHIGLHVDNFDRLPFSRRHQRPPTALPHPRPGPRYPLIGDHDIQQIRRALHAAPGRHYPPVPLVIKVTAQAHQSSPSMP